jgi:hypothetical protein
MSTQSPPSVRSHHSSRAGCAGALSHTKTGARVAGFPMGDAGRALNETKGSCFR